MAAVKVFGAGSFGELAVEMLLRVVELVEAEEVAGGNVGTVSGGLLVFAGVGELAEGLAAEDAVQGLGDPGQGGDVRSDFAFALAGGEGKEAGEKEPRDEGEDTFGGVGGDGVRVFNKGGGGRFAEEVPGEAFEP